jgi:hypothetical protein
LHDLTASQAEEEIETEFFFRSDFVNLEYSGDPNTRLVRYSDGHF